MRDCIGEECCGNCRYYKPDYGVFCVNGWSQDGTKGDCTVEPVKVRTTVEGFCRHFDKKRPGSGY